MTDHSESASTGGLGAKIFLGLSTLIWLPYGLFCLIDPSFLEESAGVAAVNSTGVIELRAMYGGLQGALGVLSAFGLFSLVWRSHALVTLAFISLGVGLGRLAGAVIGDEFSAYVLGVSALELVMGCVALFFARRFTAS